MTAYIHFHVRSDRPAKRLFNVASIHSNGADSIIVKLEFSDDKHTFTDVSHVAVQPERE